MRPARSTITPQQLREALKGPLPGRAAQRWMAPQPRQFAADRPPRPAAVLILLYLCGDDWCFPLTLRGATLVAHQGQVSLPGGAQENHEPLEQTALRETAEELGISVESIEILGALTPLYIAVSQYEVTPFVGHIATRPAFQPNLQEVTEVVETSLARLLDERSRIEEEWDLPDGRHLHVPYFRIGKYKVWGATAVILGEFVWLLRQIRERDSGSAGQRS